MIETTHPDLWSFCCPDLYILVKVLCPFKLGFQKLLGTYARNMFKWQIRPAPLLYVIARGVFTFLDPGAVAARFRW